MRKITYYCDRCGKVITDEVHILGHQVIDPDSGELTLQEWGAELCKDCFEWVDAATMTAIRDVRKEAPQKKTPVNKADIDMGKVFALRDAGWSLDKIGEEFRVSGQTIANHITAYNKRKEVK